MHLLIFLAGISLLFSCTQKQSTLEMSADDRIKWWKDAKFGMFIHWGPYSQLAGEWNGQQLENGQIAEWIMKFLKIPVEEYRELAHQMNPVKFDAKAWVKLAKSTGMKYIVITAKHHDGFAMYKSDVSDYNIVEWTPFKRDPLKELSEACAEEGIKFCVYYSHREDWDHPGGYGNNWSYDNDWGSNLYHHKKFEQYLEEKAKPQLRELLTNYGPVGLVWFDRGLFTPEQGREFVDLVHSLQPATLINGRVGNYEQEFLGDYQNMNDNGMPPGGLKENWETPQTLNDTWGYSRFDTLWKSPDEVIRRLVEIVSRGGNYLLNIGPKGDGEIPEATLNIFEKVGAWVGRNSEAIYETTANPFGELPWGYCTVKGTLLYFFVRDWPQNQVLNLPFLKNKLLSAYLLSDKSRKLDISQDENFTQIQLPTTPADNPISIVVVEIEGALEVNPQIVVPDDSGKIVLNYLTAKTFGKAQTRFNRKGGFHISKWTDPEDRVEWLFEVAKPGKYQVIIDYAANKEWEGKDYEITIGKSLIRNQVICTGDWYEYQKFPAGYTELTGAGRVTISIKPLKSGDTNLMYLNSITLIPVEKIKKAGWGVN